MKMITKALLAALVMLLMLCCHAAFGGPRWFAEAPEFQIGISSRPIGPIPTEVPRDLLSGARSPRDMTKEEQIAACIGAGNAALRYVRDTQTARLWYRADVVPVSGKLADPLVWPEGRGFALLLKDGRAIEAVEVIGMTNCGARMSGCVPVPVYPFEAPFTFGTIYNDDSGDCMIFVAFPRSFDPSDVEGSLFTRPASCGAESEGRNP